MHETDLTRRNFIFGSGAALATTALVAMGAELGNAPAIAAGGPAAGAETAPLISETPTTLNLNSSPESNGSEGKTVAQLIAEDRQRAIDRAEGVESIENNPAVQLLARELTAALYTEVILPAGVTPGQKITVNNSFNGGRYFVQGADSTNCIVAISDGKGESKVQIAQVEDGPIGLGYSYSPTQAVRVTTMTSPPPTTTIPELTQPDWPADGCMPDFLTGGKGYLPYDAEAGAVANTIDTAGDISSAVDMPINKMDLYSGEPAQPLSDSPPSLEMFATQLRRYSTVEEIVNAYSNALDTLIGFVQALNPDKYSHLLNPLTEAINKTPGQ